MILNYRNPGFWKDFHTRHWLPRVPTVIRQPFKDFPFTDDLLLRSLTGFEAGLRAGDHRKQCLVSVGDVEKPPRRPLRELFRQKAESMEELERNCARTFSKRNFGLMVTNMHAVDAGIWNPVAAFLQDARQYIDFPVPRAFMDLFYGRYSSSFTGVHKDTQEIFAFVIRGEKRMLAWPFNYFLSKVKGLTAGDRYFNKRLSIDHRKYRKDAIVLDASPGDVLYWPSEYWHVAEPKSKNFSGMVSLGILRPELVLSEPWQARFKQKLLSGDPQMGLLSQDMTDVLDRPDADRVLRWATGFGFEIGGPMAESKRGESTISVHVVKQKSAVILWQLNRSKRQLVVASAGHSITLPHTPGLVALLQKVARGETVSVSKSAKYSGSEKILESYWNDRCEPKVRKLSAARDLEAWLIHWLLRVGAAQRS